MRFTKPLEERLWFAPLGDIDAWVEDIDDDDFLAELQWSDDSETIVVSCQHETRSSKFDLTVAVDTALVSPSTASALVRALQTIDDPHDYRIPPAGDEDEISAPPYKLKGWLNDEYHDLEIDERDPLRYDVRAIQCMPSNQVISALNLKFVYENQPKWLHEDGQSITFSYESWSDFRWDDYGDRFLYDEDVRSSGWRLRIDKKALSTFLDKIGLDLIVEVRIERKNKGYEYSQRNEKETKKAEFERILLLRRDGVIEAAERCFGSWKTSRP